MAQATTREVTDTNNGAYKGVVMLNKPPIDKIAALAIAEHALGTELPIALFWESNSCSPEQMLKWEVADLLPIDIGDEKYHQTRSGSASEYIADIFALHEESVKKLVALMNHNNKTGALKKGNALSIAWSLREMYEFDSLDQRDIIARTKDAIRAHLQVLSGSIDQGRSRENMTLAMEQLWERTGKTTVPFSTGCYMRDLWLTGAPIEEIEAKVGWWVQGGKVAKDERDRAAKEYAAMPKTIKEAGEFKYITLETADRFLVIEAGYDKLVDVRVVKNPNTGQGLIAGQRRTNLAALAAELERLEPGQWYYAEATQTLINGGPQYVQTPATRFSLGELGKLLEQHPPQ